MRQSSTLLKAAFLFMIGGSALTYAQVDPEIQDSIATDSADWEQDVLLSETVIVGKGVIDLEENRKTPVAVSTITKQEIQDKAVGNVEFPEIMKNTPSVYVAGQSGGFGDSKMFLRGFDQSNTAFLLNGQPINGMEDGNMYWSNWSSMTDVANAIQVQRGLGSSKLAISSVGGTVNIVTKATEKQQGGMARFVMGNDSYMKGTIAYDTGLKGKWGFSMLLDYWTGHRKFARGTAGEGQSYFFSVGYKPNDHHNLNFMIFGAPQWHDQNYSTKSESQWEKGAEFGKKYNSTYGFLNGEAMNWRRNYYHKPVANLNWDWNINSNASLSTVLYASLGRGGGTGNLGSSANTTNLLNESGEADFTTIYNNNLADQDHIGNNGNNTDGSVVKNGAIRSSVNNHFWYGAVTNFNYDTKTNWTFNVGADIRFYKGDHFRQLVDLLGLNGWRETNPNRPEDYVVTETFDANPWASLFNFADEDQRIGYDYSEWINYQGGFGQVEYKNDWFSAFVQGAFSNQSYQREDRWNLPTVEIVDEGEATENVYDFSNKKGKKVNKTGYNIKAGLAFNINDENTVFGNFGKYSRQPYLDNIFSGSTQLYNSDGEFAGTYTNNTQLRDPEVENEEITGIEVGYKYETRTLKVNVNLYHTEWANRFVTYSSRDDMNFPIEVNNPSAGYYDVTYMLTDQTQIHKGIEVDFNAKVTRKWTVRGYGSYGDWKFDGKSPFTVRDDLSYQMLDQTQFGLPTEVNLTGVKIGGAAQFTFGLGTQFEVCKGLSFDTDLNYYANLYGDPIIATAIKDILSGQNYQSETIAPYALLDAGVTYEFKFGSQKLRFRGNVYNLLNTQYIIAQDVNGYGYGLGRTYNAGIQFNF